MSPDTEIVASFVVGSALGAIVTMVALVPPMLRERRAREVQLAEVRRVERALERYRAILHTYERRHSR